MIRWCLAAAALAAFSLPAAAQSWLQPGPSSGTGYPAGSQPFTSAPSLGTTSATTTITAPAGKTIYICGITAMEYAGTAQSAAGTVTNILGPTGAAVTAGFLYSGAMGATSVGWAIFDNIPCSPAVTGQSVVVTTPTATGATITSLSVQGYFF